MIVVVVPVYNAPSASRSCLASLDRRQLVIVIDDGSAHPEVPTAVGFCVMIRRAAIDKVGLCEEATQARSPFDWRSVPIRNTGVVRTQP